MRLVVDANIIFSALLKKESNVLDIIMSDRVEIFIPKFLIIEIFKHKEKILRASKLSEDEVMESFYLILKYCTVVNDEEIPREILDQTFHDVKEVDPKDVVFVAAAMTLEARLWSGDKKLINGLKDKGIDIFVQTKDLVEFFKVEEQAE
jgi:predicted nucleic acid-binding protein